MGYNNSDVALGEGKRWKIFVEVCLIFAKVNKFLFHKCAQISYDVDVSKREREIDDIEDNMNDDRHSY